MNCTPLLIALLWLSFSLNVVNAQENQHRIASKIYSTEAIQVLETTQLLKKLPDFQLKSASVDDEVKDATFFTLLPAEVDHLLKQPAEFLTMVLPMNGTSTIELQLFKANIFTPDFRVSTASNKGQAFHYEPGVHYWGIVKGDANSLAAISITRNEIMGLVSINGENLVLGKLDKSTDGTHVFYKESDLLLTPTFGCSTDELPYQEVKAPTASEDKNLIDKCVRMYLEIDNDLVVAKGGVSPALNFLNGAFSQVSLLYANEGITLNVKEILAWDIVDPYTATTSGNLLSQFREHLNGNFNGDLAHLVGTQGGGGVAYVDVLCNSYVGVGYSTLQLSYSNVPTYSWTVEVLTHEIGHNLGSPHTHSCAWNGNNTALDGCGPTSGNSEGCTAPVPTNGGTIMSYCHLLSGVGISFNNGFGPQPGDRIRSRIANANCLTSCTTTMANDAGISTIVAPASLICVNFVNPQVTLTNYGTNNLTTSTIGYRLNNGTYSYYNWTGNLAPNASSTITLPVVTAASGNNSFFAKTMTANGISSTNPANDASLSSFICSSPSMYYLDQDGDGFGNANSTLVACNQPTGYVQNHSDCDDSNAAIHPGSPCSDGNVCTINDVLDANCNCAGTIADSDSDGVCDANDICPGGNDGLDADNDGIPNFCDCSPASKAFQNSLLTHTGVGSSSRSATFLVGDKDVSFAITNLTARTTGNTSSRYIDKVIVIFNDENGNPAIHGIYYGTNYSQVNVSIHDFVTTVTVTLEDGFDGNFSGNLSVNLSAIAYCQGCTDTDGDSVCDNVDQCPNFNNSLNGTACNDNNACTVNDLWNCGVCQGTYSDSDSDNICDALDNCPSHFNPTQLDLDGDGLGTECDSYTCSNEIKSNFGTNPLTHTGAGAKETTIVFPQVHSNVMFTISGLNVNAGGGNSKKYTEQVTVRYVNGSGQTVVHGVYSATQTSTVDVNIQNAVQSVTVRLTDGDGTPSTMAMSVNMTEVTSCQDGAGMPMLGEGMNQRPSTFHLYPNPATNQVTLTLDDTPESADIVLTNMQGIELGRFETKNQSSLQLNLDEIKASGQFIFVTVRKSDGLPETKRLLLSK